MQPELFARYVLSLLGQCHLWRQWHRLSLIARPHVFTGHLMLSIEQCGYPWGLRKIAVRPVVATSRALLSALFCSVVINVAFVLE
jgi:hypothetical protein